MNEFLVPIVVVPAFFYFTYLMVKAISDNSVRRKAINLNATDLDLKNLFAVNEQAAKINSLKWGLVAIAVSLGLIAGQTLPLANKEAMTAAFMIGFGGVALVIFYFLAARFKG